jgi:aminoglycoside phosphotransferase (APT) family kinase protein
MPVRDGRVAPKVSRSGGDVHSAEGALWRRHSAPALGVGEGVCHGDIGPHNTVYRAGLPVAFIDWDTIRPNDPIVEFGESAWEVRAARQRRLLRGERLPNAASARPPAFALRSGIWCPRP